MNWDISGLIIMDWSARNRTNHRLPFLLERFHARVGKNQHIENQGGGNRFSVDRFLESIMGKTADRKRCPPGRDRRPDGGGDESFLRPLAL